MRYLKFGFIIIPLLLILLASGLTMAHPQSVYAQKGIMDLTNWSEDDEGYFKLDGQWEFYWNRLLSFEELSGSKADLYANLPGTWNEYSLNGKALPGVGYATYRLHVVTDLPPKTQLGIRTYAFSSAFVLSVNDQKIASSGKVGMSPEEEIGAYRPQTVYFQIPDKEFDIVLKISNYEHAFGGVWYSLYLGTPKSIANLNDLIMAKEVFLIGVLIIVAFFYLTIYLFQKDLKYALYFCCLCLCLTLSIDMAGQFLLLRFLPGMPLSAVILLWYSSLGWSVFFAILFMHELFRSKFSEIIVKLYLSGMILTQLAYFLMPAVQYTRLADAYNALGFAGLLSSVGIVVIGIRKGHKDGWLNLTGMTVLLVTYLHDILFWTNRVRNSFGELIDVGLFTFIICQVIIQAHRIKLFNDHKTAAELSFLQAQIKPHFLYNALNTFASISRYDPDQARELLIHFSQYLRRSFDFKDLSQFVPLKHELELLKGYLAIEQVRFEERLEVSIDADIGLEVNVPILMLQPIVENAINHGVLPKPEGGRVDVSVTCEGSSVLFCVRDNGVGMEVRRELDRQNQYGSGVGLFNIDDRLKKLYGKGLEIMSRQGEGTEIVWRIPIDQKGLKR
ncbi:MAG: histidine kinase [Clostridia bacterium]|nr:histidine kinase [Clostridia bacterium]